MSNVSVQSVKSRNTRKLMILFIVTVIACVLYMLVDLNFHNERLLRYALRLRTPKMIVMLITAFAIGSASIVFQSIINNTIVTPCLLGMNSLYTMIHTVVTACGQAGKDSTEAGSGEKAKTVTITSLNANKEEVELEVPYDPQRIAILDLAALDIIDNLGVGDRVVGSASTSIDYLSKYANNDKIKNLGTIKEADLEAVMACEPDVIFIGGRLAASYDALSEIAPVVYLATDAEVGLVKSVTENATVIASMFGKEDEITKKTTEFQSRIEALQAVAEGKTALVGMTTSGSFNLLGNDGRCSIIGVEIGFDNVGLEAAASSERGSGEGKGSGQGSNQGSNQGSGQGSSTSSHGNEASFEVVLEKNPDYIFVMDRDSAIATEGAQLAKEIMENQLVMDSNAYKNGQIVYLANPAVWYTAEGGITALDTMLSDLESTLIK